MKLFNPGRLGLRRLALALGIFALAVLSDPSARTTPRTGAIPPKILNLMAAYGAETVTIDRNARDYKLPDQIEWKGRPGSGNYSATLFGDPSKAGLYVQLLKRDANNWSQPHKHPNDRFITVLAGTMWIGTGDKFDINNTVPLKPGATSGTLQIRCISMGRRTMVSPLKSSAWVPCLRERSKLDDIR